MLVLIGCPLARHFPTQHSYVLRHGPRRLCCQPVGLAVIGTRALLRAADVGRLAAACDRLGVPSPRALLRHACEPRLIIAEDCAGSRRTISVSVYMLGRSTGHSPVGSVTKLPRGHRMVHAPAWPCEQCDLRSRRG
eukprot:scaffold42808_cov59-Phaeocystis_antarctica.AAC.2